MLLEMFAALLVIAAVRRYLGLGRWVWSVAIACMVVTFLWDLHLAAERLRH